MDRRLLPSLTAVGTLALPVAVARASDEDVQALRAEVASLRAELDAVRRADEHWLTERRADEIRALVGDVLADADTRASLLQEGVAAGYEKGFFIQSTDGNFKLKVSGQVQFRWVWNHLDTEDGSDTDSSRAGFEARRTKLQFSGHVVDPTWEYNVLGAFDRDSGNLQLDEGWVAKKFDGGWKVRFGQFKAPFLREELVSSRRQLAVERSLVNEEFNQDRVQGVEVGLDSERWRAAAAYSDGFFPGGVGTDFTTWSEVDTEYAFTGRFEFLMIEGGGFKQFDDFTSWKGDETGLLLGAAIHYQVDEYGTTDDEVENLGLTADASAEFGGFNLFGAIVYRQLEDDTTTDLDQYGLVLQGGFFFTEEWEGFARYEYGDDDTDADELSAITLGVNRYFDKHNLKWTTDIGFGMDEVTGTWASDGAGWREDDAGGDTQVVVRSQFQLLF